MDSVFQTVEPTAEEKEIQERIEKRKREINKLLENSSLTRDEVYALWNGYTEGISIKEIKIHENFITSLIRIIHYIEKEIDPCDCRFNPNEMMLVAFALGYGAGEKKRNIEIISLLKELYKLD